MQGLRIEKDSPKPVSVKSFAMAIRNSENFLKDSTYIMQFDSILFINNSVYLSNFSFRQVQDDIVVNSLRMPQFELKGLSWDDLVFERKLTADKAKLYSPVINYSVLQNKKQNIFQTLAGIGGIIQLNNLDLSNGQINVHFKGGVQLHLENASISILSRDLLRSKRIANLQRSVGELRFKEGSLKTGSLTAEMENVIFTGKDGQLTAASMYLINKEKSLVVNAKKVAVNKMMIDNNSHITEITGIQWQQADVQVTGLPFKRNSISPGFIVRNLKGGNTMLTTSAGNQKLTVFLQAANNKSPIEWRKSLLY
jgi:hypothetical protein